MRQNQKSAGSIVFSCPQIEIQGAADEVLTGSFLMSNSKELASKGVIFSSHPMLKIINPEFSTTPATVMYECSLRGLEEGESYQGEIVALSDCGEYTLPFHIQVKSTEFASSLGPVRNLFHFANLAKSNINEAASLFYDPKFEKLLQGSDRQYSELYRGLSGAKKNLSNLEEFLIGVNKKSPIHYSVDKEEIKMEDPVAVFADTIQITKSGWGHVHLKVSTSGDFLNCDKIEIKEDDFLGNTYYLKYIIDSAALHGGENRGNIVLTSTYETIEIPVVVEGFRNERANQKNRILHKNYILELVECFERYRLKKVSTKTWMADSEKLVDKLIELDRDNIEARLYQIHLMITAKRYNEAGWNLDQCAPRLSAIQKSNPSLWGYYLYLSSLLSREEDYVDDVTKEVRYLLEQNPNEWRLVWMLQFLEEDYAKSPKKRFEFIKEQFEAGCHSPVLYAEAVCLLNEDPALLEEIGRYELQILNYARKKEALTNKLLISVKLLAKNTKEYSALLFGVLAHAYEIAPDRELLTIICSMLINGDILDERAFVWYGLGIQEEIRVTRLYEYYLMAMPNDYEGAIHKMALMYFSYQSQLDDVHNAKLYSYVHKHREEFPKIYDAYRLQIEEFLIGQIKKKKITQDLAYLYQNFITEDMLGDEEKKALIPLLMAGELVVHRRGIQWVHVYYPGITKVWTYPVSKDKSRFPVYNSEYCILLEDAEGNRFGSKDNYSFTTLIRPDKLMEMAKDSVDSYIGLDIHLCTASNRGFSYVNPKNVERFRRLSMQVYLTEAFRSEIINLLLAYYYDNDELKSLDVFLKEIDVDRLRNQDKNNVIKYMVLRGMYDEAMKVIEGRGSNGIDEKVLLRLCSYLIERDGLIENKALLDITYEVFMAGKYDDRILAYLVAFYEGPTKSMKKLYRAAKNYEIDLYPLCETILLQLLFTGSYMGEQIEILKIYIQAGGRTSLIEEFLANSCMEYVLHDQITDAYVFEALLNLVDQGITLHRVCKIAFCRYYAQNQDELKGRVLDCVTEYVKDLLESGIYFPFFKDYVGKIDAVEKLADKTILEYHIENPGNHAVIHYMFKDGDSEEEYVAMDLPEMYMGICVKSFVLFFGETLQYYITESDGENEVLTLSGVLSNSDIYESEAQNRFMMINEMAIAQTLEDYVTMDELMEQYYKKQYLVQQIFGRKEEA